MTPWAAKWAACWDEPHWRSTEVAGTDSGNPAARTALRPMLSACSPTCMTHPMITSSTSAGSRLLRSTRALSTSAARSTGCQLLSFPLSFFPRPPPVRTASTIAALVMPRTLDAHSSNWPLACEHVHSMPIPERGKSAEERLERILELQTLLARVAREIGPALELQGVLSTVLDSMRTLVEFRG